MALYDYEWRIGDTFPTIEAQLTAEGIPLANMDTSTVRIKIVKWRTLLPLVVNQPAVIFNATLAYVSYKLSNGAPTEAGLYEIFWDVTKSGGDTITIPTGDDGSHFMVWPEI